MLQHYTVRVDTSQNEMGLDTVFHLLTLLPSLLLEQVRSSSIFTLSISYLCLQFCGRLVFCFFLNIFSH